MLSNPLSIGMRALAFFLFVLFASLAGAKTRHCILRLHAEGNARDTEVFSRPIQSLSGKPVAIEKIAAVSEQDVVAFRPYQAADGSFGALIQLDEHGRLSLDAASVEHRGSLMYVFLNGRALTELQIDRRISDGKIYLASGLTKTDLEAMRRDWPIIKARKK